MLLCSVLCVCVCVIDQYECLVRKRHRNAVGHSEYEYRFREQLLPSHFNHQ